MFSLTDIKFILSQLSVLGPYIIQNNPRTNKRIYVNITSTVTIKISNKEEKKNRRNTATVDDVIVLVISNEHASS